MNTILRKQFLAHVGQTSPSPMLVEVARAEGSFFYTPEGKRYYDLVAGVSVSNVGHCNPAVVKAVQEQAARYMHVMVYGELVETPQVEYLISENENLFEHYATSYQMAINLMLHRGIEINDNSLAMQCIDKAVELFTEIENIVIEKYPDIIYKKLASAVILDTVQTILDSYQ